MFNTKLNAEQRLHKAVSRIMADQRYTPLAGILMLGERRIKDDVPTACTNGRDEYYGRAFVDSLSDAELRFVIVHEAYHKMYRHLITWKHLWEQNPTKANRAMDYVINLKIVDENKDGFCQMPMRNGEILGCLDERFRGMDTAQVYKLLPDEPQSDGGSGGSGDSGFDEHDFEGAQDMDPEERRALEQEIDTAIRQAAIMAGKMGLDTDRTLGELLRVQVDWREALREFITTTCAGADYATWRRPNRRYLGAGVYMPSAISERVGELCIAIDTSGSIGKQELTAFLSEVAGICGHVKPEKIRLLYWDMRVRVDESYAPDEYDKLVRTTKPKGGGGTDVNCVPDYITKNNVKPQAAIVLTDGYLYNGWGHWQCPVLWVVMDNRNATPTCGKTLHITVDDL